MGKETVQRDWQKGIMRQERVKKKTREMGKIICKMK